MFKIFRLCLGMKKLFLLMIFWFLINFNYYFIDKLGNFLDVYILKKVVRIYYIIGFRNILICMKLISFFL